MNIDFGRFDIHIENLFPGLAILTISRYYFEIDLLGNVESDIFLGAAFIAVAYMAGAVGNILAYLLLNQLSQLAVRPWMLIIFRPSEFKNCEKKTPRHINKRYSCAVDIGAECGNPRVETEVEKRRQTGRILRSSLIPSMMLVFAYLSSSGQSGISIVGYLVVTYIALLLLYAFAEYVLFKECTRAERIQDKRLGNQELTN